MRILALSFYFEPDLSAGSFRMSALAHALAARLGPEDQLDILTTQPNRYHDTSVAAARDEVRGNVRIQRFPLPAHRSGFRDQAFSFAAYARQVIRAVGEGPYDLVFATSSRLMTAALGAYLASRLKAALYLDLRDIFVDTIGDVLSGPVRALMVPLFSVVEGMTLRKAARINLVSAGFVDYFRQRYPSKRLGVIPNGIDESFFGVDFSKPEGAAKPILLYAGNIGEGQGLERIIPGLAAALADSHELWIIGDGGRRQALASAVAGQANFQLQGPVTRDRLLALYRQADVLFLHLNDYPAFRKVLPSKLFEYAATGKPILAGLAGYPAEFLRGVNNAEVFEPCDVQGALASLNRLNLGLVDRSEFINRYRRAPLADELAADMMATLQPLM